MENLVSWSGELQDLTDVFQGRIFQLRIPSLRDVIGL